MSGGSAALKLVPRVIEGGRSVDDRGEVGFINDFDLAEAKRFYTVTNHQAGFVRAWHGHRNEAKYVTVLKLPCSERHGCHEFRMLFSAPLEINIPFQLFDFRFAASCFLCLTSLLFSGLHFCQLSEAFFALLLNFCKEINYFYWV